LTDPSQLSAAELFAIAGIQPRQAAQPAPRPTSSAPRGIRNNNPGNIEDGAFAKRQQGYAGFCRQGGFEVIRASGLVGGGARVAREALEEMRLSVRGLTGKPVQLSDALGVQGLAMHYRHIDSVAASLLGITSHDVTWTDVTTDAECIARANSIKAAFNLHAAEASYTLEAADATKLTYIL
jgi:hypothetical protein